jgi:hypothetical protein
MNNEMKQLEDRIIQLKEENMALRELAKSYKIKLNAYQSYLNLRKFNAGLLDERLADANKKVDSAKLKLAEKSYRKFFTKY